MSSKQEILNRIRRQELPAAELPALTGPWIEYADREKQFGDVLTFVGGKLLVVPDRSELDAVVRGLPCFEGAREICVAVPGLTPGNFDLATKVDPHDTEVIDVAVAAGEFAVAENGAVWVDARTVKHRAVYFLAQHLVLVVPRAQLVQNLYEAYQRIAFPDRGYGLFISGPSKTADIEQSLVIGAHGPRSLTVILVGE